MKKFLLILLVVVILLLANTSYAAEVSQENGKAILTLRGPDSPATGDGAAEWQTLSCPRQSCPLV